MAPLYLLLTLAAAGADHINAGERTRALVIVAIPTGARAQTPSTDLVRVANVVFGDLTGLDLRAPEQAGVDALRLDRCDGPGRLACWVDAARSSRDPISAILVITVLPVGDGRDRVALTLIDTNEAANCRVAGRADPDEAREVVEDCIWAGSARTEPKSVSEDELESFFRARIERELASRLVAMSEFEPFGRVRIDARTRDVELWIDDVLRGQLSTGTNFVDEMRPGRRTLRFDRPGHARFETIVRIDRARTTTVAVELVSLDGPTTPVARTALLYTGLAASAIGATLGVYALARASAVDDACLVRTSDAPCTSLGAPTFSLSAQDTPSTDRDAINGGLSIPVVAAGVGAAGIGWAVAHAFVEDEGIPWWGILTGLGAGIVAATVTSLVVHP